ncbi:MAG: glycosyltransferase [Pseudomonadales bacterium]|nr:glycosyltransferase [Pseudomonadales bacterium]
MSKLVSVIIANYNYADFLAESIRPAQAQTYANIEIIYIDDGSTDSSLEIAKQFDVTILAQKNQGVCAARNNAVRFSWMQTIS